MITTRTRMLATGASLALLVSAVGFTPALAEEMAAAETPV